MTKYMLVYQGNASGPSEMTEEQQAEVLQAWGAWMHKHDSAITDAGAPTGDRATVGSASSALPILGYTVVEAESLESAQGLCDHHPFLEGAPEGYSIDVYELLPM